ncbi:DUF2783 domain-containing protein [Mesorhizobium microcysteis]|uniref:DUF2783 domain-containing protein n=1 Tax=Neoaquamicrobium microcysteis TaxID=2682781 RepID=A0A5D4GTD2_9HYPH|nr:DUF2783 domain-containing protein [Mesorhizobium microcysteis]TYR31966.1 DUF2783 domain-containing protein [Mesorhizobium microcysteis]
MQNAIGRDRLGASGDDFYAALMAAHEGLSMEESTRLNARLVLLLANEVGDLERLRAVLTAARK